MSQPFACNADFIGFRAFRPGSNNEGCAGCNREFEDCHSFPGSARIRRPVYLMMVGKWLTQLNCQALFEPGYAQQLQPRETKWRLMRVGSR
jgi:hypothetical protein